MAEQGNRPEGSDSQTPYRSILGVEGSIAVPFRRTRALEDSAYPGFAPGSRTVEAGSVHREGGMDAALVHGKSRARGQLVARHFAVVRLGIAYINEVYRLYKRGIHYPQSDEATAPASHTQRGVATT